MIRTFVTRIILEDDRHSIVLDDFARRMSVAERKIYALLATGTDWKADNYRTIYLQLGLSSSMFRSAKDSLDGKLASISELTKVHSANLKVMIDKKRSQIASKETMKVEGRKKLAKIESKLHKLSQDIEKKKAQLDKAVASAHSKHLKQLKSLLDKRESLSNNCEKIKDTLNSLPFILHQHKRRLAVLQSKLARSEAQINSPSICFGTKNLFKKQHTGGFSSSDEWKERWYQARNSNFQFVGVAKMPGGNEVARLHIQDDGLFGLDLRIPPGMREAHGETITLRDLNFNSGNDVLVDALAAQLPITVRFAKDDLSWKIHVTINQEMKETQFDDRAGCLGVDLNADHVAVMLVDRYGNPSRAWTIPMVTYGLSTDQCKDLTRKVAKQITDLAHEHNVPIVAENLDFARKKAQLTADSGAHYARMLSSLTYASFGRALASACARNAIHLKQVNPAFTSLIGRTKFAHRYGLSVHAAAALSIARRAMGFSERLPTPIDGEIILPLDNGDRVTLPRPVRIEGRHVWSSWRRLNTGFKAAHVAHRLARRKSRSSKPHSDGPNSELAFVRRINDPLPVDFTQGGLG